MYVLSNLSLSQKSSPNKITAKRMDNIIKYLTYDTFRYISRGFYEKHKFLYALVLSFKTDLNRKTISQGEINYILKVCNRFALRYEVI